MQKLKLTKVKQKDNEKVKNATRVVYDGIEFKSKLEAFCYAEGLRRGYKLRYEELKIVLHEGEVYDCYMYAPITTSKFIEKRTNLQLVHRGQSITYNPDFHIWIKNTLNENVLVVLECKGLKTSTYNLKKNLFVSMYNKKYGQNFYFLEPHNQKQIKQAFDIIDDLSNKNNN